MNAEIHMPSVMKGVSIQAIVTGQRRTAARIWLGCKLLALAARVIGCNIEISTDPHR